DLWHWLNSIEQIRIKSGRTFISSAPDIGGCATGVDYRRRSIQMAKLNILAENRVCFNHVHRRLNLKAQRPGCRYWRALGLLLGSWQSLGGVESIKSRSFRRSCAS